MPVENALVPTPHMSPPPFTLGEFMAFGMSVRHIVDTVRKHAG